MNSAMTAVFVALYVWEVSVGVSNALRGTGRPSVSFAFAALYAACAVMFGTGGWQ